jgi:hypothetical protein
MRRNPSLRIIETICQSHPSQARSNQQLATLGCTRLQCRHRLRLMEHLRPKARAFKALMLGCSIQNEQSHRGCCKNRSPEMEKWARICSSRGWATPPQFDGEVDWRNLCASDQRALGSSSSALWFTLQPRHLPYEGLRLLRPGAYERNYHGWRQSKVARDNYHCI